ncbi:hypothetical protein EJ04DRAFT_587256 [Polyplosphaeria fusca]|uniref:Heterokaryon incompatibility domain-containing protein n=1 Tax=Polyplosphaeria fusca TaxID=682080 RepID=A0A9P4QSC9_9PLEO|nr:hypothetical protein EJ04DRAFT_587256 [Polyplosphaeria fusca]
MDIIYQAAELVVVWLGSSFHSGVEGIPHLEHLLEHGIKIPLFLSMFVHDKAIVSLDLGIGAKAVHQAYWFKQVWVVQELCWAKSVVFMMNETEMSSEVILKSFELIQGQIEHIHTMAEDWDGNSDDLAMIGFGEFGTAYDPILFP